MKMSAENDPITQTEFQRRVGMSPSRLRQLKAEGLPLKGKRVDYEEAVAWMTRSRGPRLRPLVGWPSLTPIEQVSRARGRGLSNPEIAVRLLISRSTVKTHLNHAFTKLDISSRAELAAAYTRMTTP